MSDDASPQNEIDGQRSALSPAQIEERRAIRIAWRWTVIALAIVALTVGVVALAAYLWFANAMSKIPPP